MMTRLARRRHLTALGGTLAVFDLDRTLVPGSSLIHLARAMAAGGLLRRRELAFHGARNVAFARRGASDERVRRLRAELLRTVAGLEYEPIVALSDEVAGSVAGSVYSSAGWLLERHLKAGNFCVVVSSSPQELVDEVAKRLGAHRAVGTRAEVREGRFTGELNGPFCYGAGKLERLRTDLGIVDLRGAHAYSDSASDLPLLRGCGHPVAVNPDRRLLAAARRAGWPVIHLG